MEGQSPWLIAELATMDETLKKEQDEFRRHRGEMVAMIELTISRGGTKGRLDVNGKFFELRGRDGCFLENFHLSLEDLMALANSSALFTRKDYTYKLESSLKLKLGDSLFNETIFGVYACI